MEKKLYTCLLAILFFASSNIFAQAPNSFNYQAVLRNSNGNLITGQIVEMRFTIRNGSAAGPAQYVETRNLTPNQYGIVNHAIGTGTVISGTFAGITWSNGTKFLQVEVNTGSGFVSLGAEQLRSVPYALNSGGGVWTTNGNNISNTNSGNVGIGTSSPVSELHVRSNSGNCDLLLSPQSGSGWNFSALTGSNDLRIARFNNNNYTDILNITTTNRVGINTVSPIQDLDVSGRISVRNGVIQRGGSAITATSDLGLYSRNSGSHIRLVSNNAPIQFYTTEGTSGIGQNVAFEVQGNASGSTWIQMSRNSNEPTVRPSSDNYGYLGHAGRRWYRAYVTQYYGTSTSIFSISDKSMKTNVKPLSEGMASLMKLRPVSYDFIPEKLFPEKETREKMTEKDLYNQLGFIAQELDEVFPVLTRDIEQDGTVLKTVGYSGLIPVIVKGMQEQQAQIEAQKAEIEELKQMILKLSNK